MKSIHLSLAPLLLTSAFMVGCATTAEHAAPTHRWASTTAADENRYQNDHAQCQAQAGMSRDEQTFNTGSAEFTQYQQCMGDRGYVLTAYNP